VVDGAAQFASKDGVAFKFAVFVFEVTGEGVEMWVVAFAEDGGFSKGPAEVGVAEFGSAQSFDLAGARDGSFDKAGVAEEVTDGGEAGDGVDLVEDGEGEGGADAGDGLEEGEVAWLMSPSLGEKFFFKGFDGVVVVDDELDILLEAEALSGVVGDGEECLEPLLTVVTELGDGGEVARELVGADTLEELGALPDVGGALSQEGAHRALGGGISIAGGNEVAA